MTCRSQWEQYPRWQRVLLIATSLPFLIAARAVWQSWPGVELCALFWLISLADEPLRWRFIGSKRRICYGLAFLGALCNAVATLANGGYMPVLNMKEPSSVWVPMTEASRVAWLCDIYPIGFVTGSLGDLFIVAALLGLLLVWAAEKVNIASHEVITDGKRAPGFGIG